MSGCSPMTPSPSTTASSPTASWMCQWRKRSCAGSAPSFATRMRYEKTKVPSPGSESAREYLGRTLTRIPSVAFSYRIGTAARSGSFGGSEPTRSGRSRPAARSHPVDEHRVGVTRREENRAPEELRDGVAEVVGFRDHRNADEGAGIRVAGKPRGEVPPLEVELIPVPLEAEARGEIVDELGRRHPGAGLGG